ncbi:MAG: RHS repeat-associated core domain-containing protein [Halothiobacillus sp.]
MNTLLRRTLFLSLCLVLTVTAVVLPNEAAACGPGNSGSPCDGSGPASQGNGSGTNQGAGNPINVITGNKYEHEVDLPALPGVMGLEITRYYNSTLASPQSPRGILGRGWKLSYETSLYAIGNTLQIMQADGTRIIYQRDPGNPSECATKDPAQGRLQTTLTPQGEEYLWTWTNGRRLIFNAQGKLFQIKAPTGERVHLDYNASGQLLKVTDPQGRSLTLNYPSPAQTPSLGGVQSIDSPVGRFIYTYGSQPPKGYTGDPRLLVANLAAVRFPSAVSRRYFYEDPRHPTLLTGLSVESPGTDGQPHTQRIRTWAYDAQGRGVLSVMGKPRQIGPDGNPVPGTGIEQVNLDFSTSGKTILTNSQGQKTIDTYMIINNEYRLLNVTGAGCTSCGESDIAYGYDPLGRLIETTRLGPSGQPLTTTRTPRDAEGRVVSVSVISYRDGKAQPAQMQVRYEYVGGSVQPTLIARPSIIPGKEHQICITYNPDDQPLSIIESGFSPIDTNGQTTATPITRTTTYRYSRINGRSLLTQIDGPLRNGPSNSPADSDITRYTWDKRGDYPVEITQPGNLVSRVEARDEAGRPTAVREVNGQLTQLHYAYTGQTTQIERAGRQVSIAYDAQMLPTVLRSNDGQTIRIAYLPEQGKLRYTLPDGQTLEESYNSETQITALGWLDAQGHALGQPGRYAYDAHTGQLAGITLPSGLHAAFEYDASGQLSHWQQGKATGSQHFDPQARLLEADVAGAKYRASADEQEASLALTLPTGAIHTELIDDFGRVVQQTSPERGTRTATYDLADHTLEVRDAVRVMSARYDAAGRLLERSHQDINAAIPRRVVRTTWQGVNLIRIDDPEQITEYTYDAQARRSDERITLKAQGQTAQTYFTRYRYDALGRLHQTILPEGATLTTHYNAIGQVERVDYQAPAYSWWVKVIRWVWKDYGTAPLIADIQTDSAHGVLGYTHANGQRVTTGFDQALRLTRKQDGTSNTQLTYNADDEIAQLKRNIQTLALNYDLRGRLQQVAQGTRRHDYTLDTNGNRLGKTDNTAQTQPYAYRPASDQLLGTAAHTYRYNAVGEPVQIESSPIQQNSHVRQLAYGPMGELTSVTDDGELTASYRYNQNLQRIAKTVNGRTTFFLWQGGSIAAETDAQGHIEKRYIYLGSRPVAMIQYDKDGKPSLYAIHTDHLGTPLQVTDEQRQIVWQAEYDVFGRATVRNHSLHSGASPPGHALFGIGAAHASIAPVRFDFNLRLPGQYEDAETGYYYNFHRYYNPDTGRYLTPDPIGLEGGTNVYAYVDGNPAGASDPLGLDIEPADSSLIPGSGLVAPWNAATFGTAVHNLVWDSFISKLKPNPLLNIYTDPSPSGNPFGGLRPDAYSYGATGGGSIWELKPMSYQTSQSKYNAAQTQVQGYINVASPRGGTWIRGSNSTIFGGALSLDIGGLIFNDELYRITIHPDSGIKQCTKYGNISPPNSGLVFYTYENLGKFKNVSVPNTSYDTVAKMLAAMLLLGAIILSPVGL